MRLFLSLFLLMTFQAHAQDYMLPNGMYADLKTNKGHIIVRLAYETTPLTVINFVALAEGTKHSNIELGKPFYSGLKFHRVIKNFMIQAGDPKGDGSGGPGYTFHDEITTLKHDSLGTLSMANSGPHTNGSQFFITHSNTPWLDGKHTVFGRVIQGMNVVNKIQKNDTLLTVTILRIGKKANDFHAHEDAFQRHLVQPSKEDIETKQALETFATAKYPHAFLYSTGYFVQIDQPGTGDKAHKGEQVSISLSIKSSDGKIIRSAGKPVHFSVGMGRIIKLVDDTTLHMKVGEERIIIAPYHQVYGATKRANLNPDSILIFDITLLSIKK